MLSHILALIRGQAGPYLRTQKPPRSLLRRGTPEQQAARIEAAELKRAIRALTADRNAYRSWCGNPCLSCSDHHNPTFVNRSE